MSNIKVGEYGVVFYLNTGFDMSAFTGLSLEFTKPSGATLTKTDPDVSVPGGNQDTDLGTFLGGEYAAYTFASGEVDESGQWSVILTYNEGAAKRLISDIAYFTVDDE